MARAKEVWVSAQEGARILTSNTDHEVTSDYVRMLARLDKIETRPINERENEYLKSDLEKYRVRPRNAPRVRPRPSVRKDRSKATSQA